MKQFLKSCSVSNYTKKIRQLLEKIEENSKFIENERSKVSFSISDDKMVAAWETNIKNKGTPLLSFFESWNKVNKIQKRKKITKNDELAENLPMIKKLKKKMDSTEVKSSKDGPLELFPSDSEDENNFGFNDDNEPAKEVKPKKQKKIKTGKKKIKKKKDNVEDVANDTVNEEPDMVQEFNVKDW